MPLYEYECDQGHRSEAIRPMMASSDVVLCPECKDFARRVMSVVNHNFDAVITAADVKNDFSPSPFSQHIGYGRRQRKLDRERQGVEAPAVKAVDKRKLDPRMMAKPGKVEVE